MIFRLFKHPFAFSRSLPFSFFFCRHHFLPLPPTRISPQLTHNPPHTIAHLADLFQPDPLATASQFCFTSLAAAQSTATPSKSALMASGGNSFLPASAVLPNADGYPPPLRASPFSLASEEKNELVTDVEEGRRKSDAIGLLSREKEKKKIKKIWGNTPRSAEDDKGEGISEIRGNVSTMSAETGQTLPLLKPFSFLSLSVPFSRFDVTAVATELAPYTLPLNKEPQIRMWLG